MTGLTTEEIRKLLKQYKKEQGRDYTLVKLAEDLGTTSNIAWDILSGRRVFIPLHVYQNAIKLLGLVE